MASYLGSLAQFNVNVDTWQIYQEQLDQFLEVNKIKNVRHDKSNMSYQNWFLWILKSDGGRQFTSEQFKQFAKDFDIELVNSSPTYAQSNGMVERAIQTVKKMLSKALEDGLDWN
ncbi:Ribonuclease H-like domain,Integrase, catalytic core [Cinara cedri]|uniref:Ribonuclease H-like domain,Integrase, catalytic core n=1 Tax=Cinara cedri TaxID=506608 RepID=A0A5E4NDG8_9HEMI|nr:Ribonuclease H-like domain,Integrase, catalytic core [Cinara cedri]